ncbi:MAG: biotin--[acetyl-CoA-carboxylase] ligase [Methanotrichaceae archaeon]
MSREEILSCLLQKQGSWMSGAKIAIEQGVSRAAIWKQIQSMRAEGYEIESSTKKGYRLLARPDLLHSELIKNGLRTKFVGKTIHCYPAISSTNAVAKEMASSAQDGTVVLAEVQTEGRGRMNRSWGSPSGGVWMSVILKPEMPPSLASRINIAASLAVARAIFGLYGLDVGIKWPNDLTIKERKVCGILTEISAEMDQLNYVVVGMGINANVDPSQFQSEWNATSLSEELGQDVSKVKLVQQILFEIEQAYKEMIVSFEKVNSEWSDRSTTLGRRVRIISRTCKFECQAIALDEDGTLRVRDDNGTETRVLAGDCVHLRPAHEDTEYL